MSQKYPATPATLATPARLTPDTRAEWHQREQKHLKYMRNVAGVPDELMGTYCQFHGAHISDRGFADKFRCALEIAFTEKF